MKQLFCYFFSVHKFKYTAFKSTNGVVAFLIAGNVSQTCNNIPVYDNTEITKLSKIFGQLCSEENHCTEVTILALLAESEDELQGAYHNDNSIDETTVKQTSSINCRDSDEDANGID